LADADVSFVVSKKGTKLEPQPKPADPAERLLDFIYHQPLEREAMYKTLRFCTERHLLHEVEEAIAAMPEFSRISRNQYVMIKDLTDQGGLQMFELDAAGAVVTEQQKEGLSEDEVDDLVTDFAYQTTEVGLEALAKVLPSVRARELFDEYPEYESTFREVLEFLVETHSMGEVDTFLRGRDVLTLHKTEDNRPIQPSVFVDKLERAGLIFWQDGWKVSPAGKELVEADAD
jgi:hypothetical protein